MEKYMPDEMIEEYFSQCVQCYCCTRHCHNRPKSLYNDEVTITEYQDISDGCNCNCRHMARHIKYMKLGVDRLEWHPSKIFYLFTRRSIRIRPPRARSHQENPLVQP